jgi:hypothetical protein
MSAQIITVSGIVGVTGVGVYRELSWYAKRLKGKRSEVIESELDQFLLQISKPELGPSLAYLSAHLDGWSMRGLVAEFPFSGSHVRLLEYGETEVYWARGQAIESVESRCRRLLRQRGHYCETIWLLRQMQQCCSFLSIFGQGMFVVQMRVCDGTIGDERILASKKRLADGLRLCAPLAGGLARRGRG